MSWNYRLVKLGTKKDPYYQVCEVYYFKNGKIKGWIEAEKGIIVDEPQEVRNVLTMMMIDVHKAPILIKKVDKKGKEYLEEIK